MSYAKEISIKLSKFRLLSGNMIKILAAILMTVDHIGVVFYPYETSGILRIIGRLSMPLFAFMISEGARYTKNKLKYFGLIALLATACQLVFYFATGVEYYSILVTFSISIIIIYALRFLKWSYLSEESNLISKIVSPILFLSLLMLVYYATTIFDIDYGFSGIMMPVAASLFDLRGFELPEKAKRFDSLTLRILTMGLVMLAKCFEYGGIIWYSMLALPILLLYSGKRGKSSMKYFFYIFYPLHLVIIEAIYIILYLLSR